VGRRRVQFSIYDIAVNKMLQAASVNAPAVHVFDPDEEVRIRLQRLLPSTAIYQHAGIPDGLEELRQLFR
jgi:hypothetical protein